MSSSIVAITVESATFLPDSGFAVYCVKINAAGSDTRIAKRYSALKAHADLVLGAGSGFPPASTLSYWFKSSQVRPARDSHAAHGLEPEHLERL